MRERPVLFSGEMVRRILAKQKRQTRRLVKRGQVFRFCRSDEGPCDLSREERAAINAEPFQWEMSNPAHPTPEELLSCCPYGVPGDRLWVRETWGLLDSQPADGPGRATLFYRSTDGDRRDLRYQRWRPSIHMPRWASRLLLEVTAVRVERLAEVSIADCHAEGFAADAGEESGQARARFMAAWDALNGSRAPWASSPWVWVISFARVQANA